MLICCDCCPHDCLPFFSIFMADMLSWYNLFFVKTIPHFSHKHFSSDIMLWILSYSNDSCLSSTFCVDLLLWWLTVDDTCPKRHCYSHVTAHVFTCPAYDASTHVYNSHKLFALTIICSCNVLFRNTRTWSNLPKLPIVDFSTREHMNETPKLRSGWLHCMAQISSATMVWNNYFLQGSSHSHLFDMSNTPFFMGLGALIWSASPKSSIAFWMCSFVSI